MPPNRVPFTFSIVGVQKAATSTLYDLLIQHRSIVSAKKKERHFFDKNAFDWDDPDYSGYKIRRHSPEETVAGDATPSYIFWPYALPRMRAYRADMSLVACFRDPVERAFSHWNMDYVRRQGVKQFGEAVRIGRASEIPPQEEWAFPAMRRRSTVARGLYGAQLQRGLESFPREQWLLLEFRATVKDLPGACAAITDHLGLERFTPEQTEAVRNASSTSVDADPVTAEDVEILVSEYADDLPLFTRLSGLDVSAWPTARVLAGDLAPGDLAATLNAKAGLTGR